MKNWWAICAFAFAFPLVCTFAQDTTQDQEARLQKLESIIQEQEQAIEALESRVNRADQNQQNSREYTEQIIRDYMSRPEVQETAVVAGYEAGKGFFIKNGDGKAQLYISGFLQMGLAVFENDTHDRNSFYPNGCTLAFDFFFNKNWHVKMQLNFLSISTGNSPATPAPGQAGGDSIFQSNGASHALEVWDAYVEYQLAPEANFMLGQMTVPFAGECQYNPNQGLSIWTEPFTKWGHGYDTGLMLWGALCEMLEYRVMLANGDGMNALNRSDDMLMAGMLKFYPFGRDKNADTYLQVSVVRSRASYTTDNDDTVNTPGRLRTPWGRRVYDGVLGSDVTHGWKTGVDVAGRFDYYFDDQKVNRVRFEMEYMYMTWERFLNAGRQPWLQGHGFLVGFWFKHNLTPDVPEAGIFPLFKFSYTDIDNKKTNFRHTALTDINGQNILVYTFGLGYSFNRHVTAQFNWVMVNLSENDLYRQGTRNDRADQSDDVEHGWFFQVTAQW